MAFQRTKGIERLTVEMGEELSKRVDDYRFENRVPTKVAAIRELIEAGLAAKAKGQAVS